MRLTTQYTEVAGQETSGNIKVVRQYASVLYLTPNTINHEASANHALGLTHVANTIWKYGVGSHDLGLTDNAVVTGDRSVNVAHDLNLSQVADRSSFGTGTTNLNLNSIVDYFNIVGDRNVAGHELGLIQEVQTLSGIHVESDLGLTDTANGVGPFKEHVSHHMFLTQTLPTPHRLWVEDELALTQFNPTPKSGNASDTLNLSDLATITNVDHDLGLTDVATFGKFFSVSSEMNITDAVLVSSLWNRLVFDDLGIGHAMTWFDDSPCTRKSYTPFQGENTVNTTFDQPPASLPVVHKDATVNRFTLYYPSHDAIARQLIFRAPELDNRDRNAYTRVAQETRGGSLIIYADPIWPKIRSLVVTITGLIKTEVDDFQDFIYATIGQQIEVCDWEGRLWSGVIINPDEPVAQDSKEKWTISFTLEGEVFEDEQPAGNNDGFALNMSDEATYVLESP
jgi:hypothetical protein